MQVTFINCILPLFLEVSEDDTASNLQIPYIIYGTFNKQWMKSCRPVSSSLDKDIIMQGTGAILTLWT